MGFVAVSTLIKTHFHVSPPTPTWNLYLPTWNFFNTHPKWNIHPKLKQLLWGGILNQLFYSASLSFSTLKLHFVDPNFSILAL